MSKKIRIVELARKIIRDTSTPLPRVSPSAVAAALGAEPTDQKLEEVLAPITLFAIRSELFHKLQSSGGRPALAGTSRRAKIPLADAEWAELEELAKVISGPGFHPTAGQIASVLIRLSLRSVTAQIAKSVKPASTQLEAVTNQGDASAESAGIARLERNIGREKALALAAELLEYCNVPAELIRSVRAQSAR